ncbi:MAG: hypothetical protein R3D71_04215 [Rickettsiales bacterium]
MIFGSISNVSAMSCCKQHNISIKAQTDGMKASGACHNKTSKHGKKQLPDCSVCDCINCVNMDISLPNQSVDRKMNLTVSTNKALYIVEHSPKAIFQPPKHIS